MRGYLSLLCCALGLALAADKPIEIGQHDNIVVVGGGPAGLHYASRLAEKGFSKITLIDSGDVVGGKSKTIFDASGTPHEMGTCYATTVYGPVFDLINKYDPTNVKVPFAMDKPGHTWVHLNDDTVLDYNYFMVQDALNVSTDNPAAVMGAALTKYIALHRSIFGKYSYGMPPEPKDWTLIKKTALQFVHDNELGVLEAFFRSAFQRQGYGILDDTPAFYLLWWVHPDMILGQMAHPTEPSVFVLSKGFQSIWIEMAKALQGKVTFKLQSTLTDITRAAGDKTLLEVTTSAGVEKIVADHVVMAIDLSRPDTPKPTAQTPTEGKFLHSLSSMTFVTTHISSPPVTREGVCQWWPYRGAGDLQGRLQATRNSHLALQGSSFNSSVPVSGAQDRVAYQFYNRAPLPSDDDTASLVADLNAIQMTNPKLMERKVWNYAPRFPQDMLEQGALWKIFANQGEAGTTWIGSSVCFESVLDVVEYNNRLIERVQFKA